MYVCMYVYDVLQDSVTGLALSPDGGLLLSNSMDSSLRCWDVRPFAGWPNLPTYIYMP